MLVSKFLQQRPGLNPVGTVPPKGRGLGQLPLLSCEVPLRCQLTHSPLPVPSSKLCFRCRELLGRTGSAHAGGDATRVSGILFSPAAAGEQIQGRPLEHLLQIHLYPYPLCGDSHCILEFRTPRNAAENKQTKKPFGLFLFIPSI